MRKTYLLLSFLYLAGTAVHASETSKAQLMAKIIEMMEHSEEDDTPDAQDSENNEGLNGSQIIEL